jgi:hypothetical protein
LTLPTSGTNLLADNGSGALTIQTINSGSSNALTLQSNNATAMTIDTSQNVGIGLNYGAAKFAVAGPNVGANGANATYPGVMQINDGGRTSLNETGGFEFKTSVFGSGYGAKITALDAGDLLFGQRSNSATWTERMRIASNGDVYINQTATTGNNAKFQVTNGATNAAQFIVTNASYPIVASQNGSGSGLIYFNYNAANVGTITTNGSATAYNTSSDYRLKNDVQPLSNGLATVSALNPVTYNWISNGSKGEGFIAHELQTVIPDAVTGTKDAVDADGKPVYQGVDYSKVVVHLVAALQEAVAKIDAQAADIAALKAKVGV